MTAAKSSDFSRAQIAQARRIVVKIGSSVLTGNSGALQDEVFERFARQMAELQKKGKEFLIVSSGAIVAGRALLQFVSETLTIPQKQAAAAVGQGHLIHRYDRCFRKQGITTAQILLTHTDLAHRSRYLNARHTVFTLLENQVIPIINENDSVVVEEIKFGDNDTLAALMTPLAEADLLILLSDIDGLFDANPSEDSSARLIPLVRVIDDQIERAARPSSSKTGVGGMVTKIAAAQRAASYGVPTVIANGHQKDTLPKILAGEMVGTLFLPAEDRLKSRKHWIAHTLRAKGVLRVDSGAEKALSQSGRSLLPSGIVGVEGEFRIGDAVQIQNEKKRILAQGLVNYNAQEIKKIMGKNSSEIQKILGYKYYDEIIHRDDLVLVKGK